MVSLERAANLQEHCGDLHADGCLGFQCKFELQYEQPQVEDSIIDEEEDVVITASLSDGTVAMRVVIDEASLDLLRG